MSTATYLVGDVFDRVAELPDGSVDLVLTSPPFLALRSYLPADHPDKGKEIGSEPTPAEFLDTLLELTAEWGRVLAPHGSIAIELGDTYAGSGGAGGDYNADGLREGQQKFSGTAAKAARAAAAYRNPAIDGGALRDRAVDEALGVRPARRRLKGQHPGWPLDKSLCLIPELYAVALSYGINPLTGTPSPAGLWRVRTVKPWIRSNPPVGALGDKERPATSYVIVATRARDRYFDLDAVRTPGASAGRPTGGTNGSKGRERGDVSKWDDHLEHHPAGAPPRDWWHNVDAVLDAELDRMAGKPRDDYPRSSNGTKVDGRDGVPRFDTRPAPGAVGARGVHLRRALEAAGILTTAEAIDQSPKGYRGAHYACVDDATEALTPHGWRRHDQLTDGDLIAVWSPTAETWRFEPATFHRYPFSGDLVAIDKRVTTQRLTPNHRVAYRTRKDPTPRFREADTLTSGCQLPLAAPMESGGVGPGEKAAALAGWFCAEGAIVHGRPVIYQSESANPAHVQHLRSLLDGLGADYTERTRHRTGVTGKPHVVVAFTVRGGLGEWLRQFHKSLPMSAVFGWSEVDAAALFDALIDGDGHRRSDGRCSFIQKDQAVAERVQMLAVRLGYRTTLTTHSRNGCYVVQVSPGRWVDLRAGRNGERPAVGTEHYEGVVWCPSVSTGAWIARRGGQPFVTGNTWPPELVRLLVDEMCPRRVCGVCGQPSRRIVEDRGQPDDRRQYRSVDGRLSADTGITRNVETVGWSDCGCPGADRWRPGLVLDPFAGSGTTLAVCTGMARDSIGIDLDARNADLARDRVGMFLTVDEQQKAPA